METSSASTCDALPGVLLRVSGRWAHFKKPETNNNPLTHDFITKTALLGLMGAVLGVERRAMRPLFPQWSDDLIYGVQVLATVQKESWSFTMREVANQNNKAPKPMELLKNPDFLVALACRNVQSLPQLQDFAAHLQQSRAHYTPVLGLHNCAAELEFVNSGDFTAHSGAYSTKAFALRTHGLNRTSFGDEEFRLGFERIPTHQNDDFWNRPEKYVEVCYPDAGHEVALNAGEYFRFADGEAWNLV